MTQRRILPYLFAMLLVTPRAVAQKLDVPPPNKILTTLNSTHPRLLVNGNFDAIRTLIHEDPLAATCYAAVKRRADRTLRRDPSEYEIPDGKRLLAVSRGVLGRVRDLGLTFHIEEKNGYAERLWQELESAAAFPDWNPSHFLDTAEMTLAFAIGYDWLYATWTEDQRTIIRDAIVRHGLEPYRAVDEDSRWWARCTNNWNQVCHGGIGVGALAIAEEEPDLAAAILHEAATGIQIPMRHYAPDGAGREGVMYWGYGTRYNVLFLACLRSALGTDFGLTTLPGFNRTGDYPLYMAGQDGRGFNFGDCGSSRTAQPQHFWLAREFGKPAYAWFRHRYLSDRGQWRAKVNDLLWFDRQGADFDPATLPLDKHFRTAECASMRSSWTDPDALVLGIQAGDNANLGWHRHLDLGSFILDANGTRWICDLGSEPQTYQRHKNGLKRWAFYRIRAEGHNTLVLNPDKEPDQALEAIAPISTFESTPECATAVLDLTAAYARHAQRVTRTFTLMNRNHVTITDEINAGTPADIWWFMHTRAQVELSADERTATLQIKHQYMPICIRHPANARFEVMPAQPLPTSPNPDIQKENRGFRKLAIHLPDTKDLTLTVQIGP